MKNEAVYRVLFTQADKPYEVYARYISEETLMGFIEIEELVFNESASLLVDPGEEKMKLEFTNVKRCYIPMHAILRIDEVLSTTKANEVSNKRAGNVSHFPNKASSSNSSTE